MRSLPSFFAEIEDPRRSQGRRHRLSTVLAIAAGAVLCGMRSYEAIFDWADSLTQKSREHFRCRYEKGRYSIPSLSIIRDVLVRVDPHELEAAFIAWNKAYAQDDESLAIDGKVMCNAVDEKGRQTQIISNSKCRNILERRCEIHLIYWELMGGCNEAAAKIHPTDPTMRRRCSNDKCHGRH